MVGDGVRVLNAARQAGGAVGVAAFGALVAGGRVRIVPGLHAASLGAAALMVGSTALAWFGVRASGEG